MAWCRPGDKQLTELMMVSLLTHICITRPQWVNPLAFTSTCEISPRWMPQNTFHDKSWTLVQVLAWCHQVLAWCCQVMDHYLSHFSPRYMLQYGITKPQRVNVQTAVLSTEIHSHERDMIYLLYIYSDTMYEYRLSDSSQSVQIYGVYSKSHEIYMYCWPFVQGIYQSPLDFLYHTQ